MPAAPNLGGTYQLGDLEVNRMGYGAMRLSGPGIYGPPRDREKAKTVLRDAVAAGVNHIDTSDFYGPHVTNQIIREALAPYPDDLVIVSKVGAKRSADRGWHQANSPDELRSAVEDNLRNLGLDQLAVVNMRLWTGHGGPNEHPVTEHFEVLAELQQQGKIRHLGISQCTAAQLAEAQKVVSIVCVQNEYSVMKRDDDALVDLCAAQKIAYVPYFPLGGFSPFKEQQFNTVAQEAGATTMQVALAWLLQRSPSMVLIPGTSSPEHLRENLAAADLELSPEHVGRLNTLGLQ